MEVEAVQSAGVVLSIQSSESAVRNNPVQTTESPTESPTELPTDTSTERPTESRNLKLPGGSTPEKSPEKKNPGVYSGDNYNISK